MRLLFILLAFCSLSACTHVEQRTVTLYQDRLVDIPDTLLQQCKSTLPPSKVEFISSTHQQREQLLADYSISLLNDIRNCNDQLNGIKKLQEEQRKIITNTKETK